MALVCAAPLPRERNGFAWVPSYPGATLVTTRTTRNGDQITYRCEFHVKGDGATVRGFFEKKLKAAGFNVMGKGGITGHGWDLRADNADGTRTIDVSGTAQREGASIGVTARMVMRAEK
jgi:hypothetical protein